MATASAFGRFVRRERQERGLLLGEMAKSLKVSPPYLSQMETGQRKIPEGIAEKIINYLSLPEAQANELRRATALSQSEYEISLGSNASEDDRALAHDLAVSFARMTPENKGKLRDILKGTRRG